MVILSSTQTAVVPLTLLVHRKTKTKTQLIILTQERLDRFGIEITCHHSLTVWIPTTTAATSVTTIFLHTYRPYTTKNLLHKFMYKLG
jgi:hypothetical protein